MARSRASANYTITAQDRTRAGIQSATASMQALDAVVNRLGISMSIMGAAGAAAPGLVMSAQAPLIEQMGQMRSTLGVSIDGFQAMGAAARAVGINMDDLYGNVEEGLLRISEASNLGTGEAAEGLQLLGISAKELAQLKPEERIYAVLEALEKVEDAGDKIFLSDKIFGGSGIAMTRLLTENIDEAADRMERLGLVLNNVDVASVTVMNQELRTVAAMGDAAAKVFTSEMAPAITGVTQLLFGATDSMVGFRDASTGAADTFIDVIGAIGNGVEGLDNVFESIKIGLEYLNVGANRVQHFFEKSETSAANLAGSMESLQSLQDNLAGQTGDATFWEKLEAQVASARSEAQAASEEMDALRERMKTGTGVDESAIASITGAGDTANDSAFQSLLDSLATGTEQVERQYAKRLGVIDDFRQAYPERANEALLAELSALESRDKALADYEQSQQDKKDQERKSTLQPLEQNYDAVRKSFQAENEIIIEEYENRKALLEELSALDLERRAEVNDLLVQLAQDKEEKIAQIEQQAVSKRVQIQSNYASQALGIAASLVSSIAGEGEKGKRIAARISQAEALVAGISAAERARNHASLTGGLVSGAVAAGLSWAGTLANVAGIEAALNGSTSGGPSTSASGTGEGSFSDIQNGLESGGEGSSSVNVTFVLNEEVFNREAIEKMAAQGVARQTQSRDLSYNEQKGYYQYNDEMALA